MVRTLRVGHDLHACGGVPLLATALDGWSTRQQLVSTPRHLFHLRILALHVHFRKLHRTAVWDTGAETSCENKAYRLYQRVRRRDYHYAGGVLYRHRGVHERGAHGSGPARAVVDHSDDGRSMGTMFGVDNQLLYPGAAS